MKKMISKSIFVLFISLLPVFSKAQSCDPLNTRQLKDMLTQMGYTVKDLTTNPGKEKYEVLIKTSKFDVPVAYEISPSGNFVWLTSNLGSPKDETSTTNAALLKQNSKIQPCQFYITEKGSLMMGLAVENRGLTPAIMRRHTDKLTNDISNTASYWQ